MPNYRGHLVGGGIFAGVVLAGLYFLLGITFSWVSAITLTIAALLGSLFPDVDTKSKGQRIFYLSLTALLIVLFFQRRYEYMIMLIPMILLPVIVHHRGLFHKTWFILIFVGFVTLYACVSWPGLRVTIVWHSLFFVLGALSHLYLDLGFRRMFKL